MKLENLASHLEKLTQDDWAKLFALIPQIESTKEFSTGGDLIEDKDDDESYIITPAMEEPIVFDFLSVMKDIDLIVAYSCMSWEEGWEIIEKKDYSNLDTITLVKLLNVFIRQDHMGFGGALASWFQNRSVEKILKEIKKNIDLLKG